MEKKAVFGHEPHGRCSSGKIEVENSTGEEEGRECSEQAPMGSFQCSVFSEQRRLERERN